MSNSAAYTIRLMNEFERAVRMHERASQHGQPDITDQTILERAKERLIRKIGQLAADAQKWDNAHDYKDRSPIRTP